MIIKVKCWNNAIKDWDECAYPLFKGMNPCEVIGFQDDEGSDKLIEDGHAVVLFSGATDKNKEELYENDMCKSTNDDGLYIVKYSESSGQWFLHEMKNGVVTNTVRNLSHQFIGDIEKVGSIFEYPEGKLDRPKYEFLKMENGEYEVTLEGQFVCHSNHTSERGIDLALSEMGYNSRDSFLKDKL